jgi:hypothetical protein
MASVKSHRGAALVGLTLAIAGCHSAGPYGHAPKYVELGDESTAVAGARQFDDALFLHSAPEWKLGKIYVFGVVESRAAGPGGQALLKLSVRRLEAQNLCERPQDEDSCRVTISDKDYGVVWALIELHGDDDIGPRAVGQRSLVRLVGTLGDDVSPADGRPVLHASYVRHWPAYFYVTRSTAAAPRRTSAR